MSDLEPGPSRLESVLLAGIYVLPLTLSIAFLAYVGLPGLALALLAVEALVSALVVLAKRPEGAPRWSPLAGGLVVLAVAAGAGASVLLVQSSTGG